MDEWHIRIDKKYLHNEAGTGARKQEQEVGGDKSVARQLLESVFDARTETTAGDGALRVRNSLRAASLGSATTGRWSTT